MRMREFIRQNRREIDEHIDYRCGQVPASAGCYCPLAGTKHYHQPDPRNDKERQLWVTNDEELYHWARNQGVPI